MPILTIPNEVETSTAFTTRVAKLIRAQDTHIYIDTSFLMWLTKIGSASRRELIDWLKQNCKGRVHVPIWSAHEYLKHHVAGTIVAELTTKTREVTRIARRAYGYFRPFIDDSIGDGSEDPAAIRTLTRDTLNKLELLISKIGRWNKTYAKHASEVISFINARTVEQTSVYELLANIEQVGSGRFIGSVPPGHQDRKKGNSDMLPRGTGGGASADSNRYGDLVFWREILDHAKHVKAVTLVIITNDRKNDWHMGAGRVNGVGVTLRALKSEWKPVPNPHPMLTMEAKIYADVEHLELLDTVYLAALLRELSEDRVRSFADVAIIPDGPRPSKKRRRRAALLADHKSSEAEEGSAVSSDRRYLFPVGPNVRNTRATVSRALYLSRSTEVDATTECILREWRARVGHIRSLWEGISEETLGSLDHVGLTKLGRELHDRVLKQDSGYEDAVTDLVSTLDQLPTTTSAAVYLGLVCSMYLVRESNSSRIPPMSPVTELLFERQSRDYALNAVYAVAKRLSDNDVAPLYIPNNDCPPVEVVLETESEVRVPDQLRSVKVGQAELLTPAQRDPSLRLIAVFGDDGWTDGESVIRKACALFGIPFAQVQRNESFDRHYALTETIGFKRPVDISIPREHPSDE